MAAKAWRGWTGAALAVVMAVVMAGTQAATVTELKPIELGAFLARHEHAVVQLTSPNPSCKYCVGADLTFDQAAALARRPGLAFARVQWSPWNKYPDFSTLGFRVYAVPIQVVFRNARVVADLGGRPSSGADFLAKVEDAIDHPPARDTLVHLLGPTMPASPATPAAAAVPAPAAPAATPYTDEQLRTVRLGIRGEALGVIAGACGRRFPARAQHYTDTVQAWRRANEAQLNQAALLAMTTGSRADMQALIDAEQGRLKSWQVDTLGIPMNKAPLQADCDKVVTGIAAMN